MRIICESAGCDRTMAALSLWDREESNPVGGAEREAKRCSRVSDVERMADTARIHNERSVCRSITVVQRYAYQLFDGAVETQALVTAYFQRKDWYAPYPSKVDLVLSAFYAGPQTVLRECSC